MTAFMQAGVQLPDWLTRRVELSGADPALVYANTRWSWGELEAEVRATASRLEALGVGAGDRVAVLLRNGPAYVAVVHALTRLGAVLVPLNVRLTPPEIAWQLADVRPRLLLFQAETQALAQAAAQQAGNSPMALSTLHLAPVTQVFHTERTATRTPPCATRPISLDAVQSIIYTSGTTGKPKGALLTYGNHWWSAIGSALNLGHGEHDRWLACLPLFHVGGLAILMRSVITGFSVVIHDGFDAQAVNEAIDRDRVTIVSVVSNMLARMLEARGDRPYPTWLRCVLLGGGPAPLPLLEACAERGIPVIQTYGLTETASQATTLSPADALRKLGSAGRPLFHLQVRIAPHPDDSTIALPAVGSPASMPVDNPASAFPGTIGEILVKGPSVTPGYFERPRETGQALRDGWLHTGDLGYVDPEGYLYVVDRREDLIVSGGENVYPAEVESVLLAHPAVAEAAVVGVPDDRWGQVPAAAVTLQAGAHEDPVSKASLTGPDLIAFCRSRLAAYKVPKRIEIVAELPRTAAGKLLRRVVRERLSEAWRDEASS